MDKYEFVKYSAERYGIDESLAETMVDMFADTLQELVSSGVNVSIDEIGEFKTTPLFPEGIKHQNNISLARLSKQNMVSFKPSKQLTRSIA